MTIWRPSQQIRVKVIGLAWRKDQLLAAEVEDDSGRIKGVRPLGGAIEFGESREEALQREFQEELETDIRIVGPWHLLENIYEHHGATGHEYIFAADIELADASLCERDEIRYSELDETAATARWFGRDGLRDAGIDLYPTGLDKLLSRWRD
ncbi:DNA mismatch repair protein MutT [Rhizobium leguminosarum bv. trifolii]|uniref:DNA mismatch repair protein MutT n=1 Tax=Rhizobium leguminosarum bv. trifolii TaxID=386 RepID=A0A1B8REG1_RHILT|nr:NUDIX domain-containing protein [Rhizobium leguminosarum]AOO90103.1 DNA mismatch repair protein MutT [Rhizobium leguminosarum bv. trifolii]OBY07113.1 DNA mismatch repair protein MutT [Rhizobium leguminosarum bv. trifolii]TBE53824.1 NUDIX domain-containing protein [Rhizobium leguminosarum]TBE91470.1 NUDIX domain-containing protein [Rhizobium leguminosarum]TBZ70440.1 NUDIX domain-containing protein [Rhizobium leguminosarum bv. viciae]